ncbi:hypothetical protein KIN20_011588 [Parelaphostrongylus tenuis]|uniref:Uncharacterized protein n=1 Tax=Parelaphostrongylus tenuis TaxID=148309 RepID=A0AAD5QJS9_PARTN|nr:hypothetical protein KIN20_011588 [Parelaphostrongylus tenuis]
MEINTMLSKQFPVQSNSEVVQQTSQSQYGNPLLYAFLSRGSLFHGAFHPSTLPTYMLRSNHVALENKTAHSSHEQSDNFETQLSSRDRPLATTAGITQATLRRDKEKEEDSPEHAWASSNGY